MYRGIPWHTKVTSHGMNTYRKNIEVQRLFYTLLVVAKNHKLNRHKKKCLTEKNKLTSILYLMAEVVAIPGLLVAAADGAAACGGCHEEKVLMLAKKDRIYKVCHLGK